MERPELLTGEQSVWNATEPFPKSPNARLLLMWRGSLSYRQSYYLQFNSWLKKISGKMSQRSRTEPSTLGLPVSLNKRGKGGMLTLERRVENLEETLCDSFFCLNRPWWSFWWFSHMFLVGLLELEMLKKKALNVSSVLGYMAKRKHP